MSRTIVFTGGGSAGHVTGNLVLIPKCAQENWKIHYIGSEQGIERKLISDLKNVTYHPISTGKLRRYFSWNNVTDIFKVIRGIMQSFRLIRNIKPDVIFAKGGFVSVPVVIGAKLNRVPIIIHEPDLNVGLANKLTLPFSNIMTTTFQETAHKYEKQNAVYVGAILKEGFLSNNIRSLSSYTFASEKPVLLIMGGSQGAQRINAMVTKVLPELLERFYVIHICGKGKIEHSAAIKGYHCYEFVNDELPDLLALADIVVSRAGSSSIMELLTLQKPMLLIPHTNGGNRSGQLAQAQYFQQAGFADILLEEEMTEPNFLAAIEQLYENRINYRNAMKTYKHGGGADSIMDLIRVVSGQHMNKLLKDRF
ncbi:undecaprenyldiphospho-muramoylpentapeptide beta-N-acetylglucosaminyltransferase [Paenibacillus endoradicis]|uniref:undecaprenyldiphospho-muramoylpentapeptide beta-N-acetylglucosaminyltransferase n=1 Tax=Paenibacillus endoradicis TaxID=2972487 RepID=UPI002158DB2F|nr:undecaprenyldiphospho-muramoylpentapeptide beta-N-acetylglucosaminyltransferase [Paenibacillus endoradicis]MCR8658663.1 undecaprenyldiphospho-muramoylpentapeptide beta-N-acetylglucosaminyltransferase [Paenibacillus endoradicis]